MYRPAAVIYNYGQMAQNETIGRPARSGAPEASKINNNKMEKVNIAFDFVLCVVIISVI